MYFAVDLASYHNKVSVGLFVKVFARNRMFLPGLGKDALRGWRGHVLGQKDACL